MLTVAINRNRISSHFKATVNVGSDEKIYAYEARATKTGQPYGKGTGYDLLSDDITADSAIVTLQEPLNSFAFDVESSELENDGNYRISIYVMNADGIWNDTCQLYTSSSETVIDSDGKNVLAKRNGSGTDERFISAYTGAEIDNFITEVL